MFKHLESNEHEGEVHAEIHKETELVKEYVDLNYWKVDFLGKTVEELMLETNF